MKPWLWLSRRRERGWKEGGWEGGRDRRERGGGGREGGREEGDGRRGWDGRGEGMEEGERVGGDRSKLRVNTTLRDALCYYIILYLLRMKMQTSPHHTTV